jgi:glycosyltransferase involved in cell wall biosynthesis
MKHFVSKVFRWWQLPLLAPLLEVVFALLKPTAMSTIRFSEHDELRPCVTGVERRGRCGLGTSHPRGIQEMDMNSNPTRPVDVEIGGAPHRRSQTASGPEHVILNVMGCRSVQYGSFEGYLVAVTRSCRERSLAPVFIYPDEPADRQFRRDIEEAGGQIVVIAGTEKLSLTGARGLWREIVRTRPAVVHSHFGRVSYLAVLLGKLAGAPMVILTRHSTAWPRISLKNRAIHTLLSPFIWRVVVVSKPVSEELPSLGVPERKGALIVPGVDTARYRPRPEVRDQIRGELAIPTNSVVIVAVAHMHVYKGLQYLVPAIPFVRERHPDVTFVIVGDGLLRPELQEQAVGLGVADSVRFVGHRQDVPELLAAADIFVCPSLSEGSCGSTLEAMAVGKPVVSTPVGLARDLLVESGSGLVVPAQSPKALAGGLSQLLEQPDRWPEMGLRAREVVERVAEVQTVADELAELYAEAVAVSPAGRPARPTRHRVRSVGVPTGRECGQ